MPFRIAVIGLGNVAVGYDLDKHAGNPAAIKTHLRGIHSYALRNSLDFEIVGVDPNEQMRARAVQYYPSINVQKDISDIYNELWDLIIICVPIGALEATLQTVIFELRPKKIVIEKPGISRRYGEAIVSNYSRNGGNLLIAYPRRCLKSTLLLENLLNRDSGDQWNIVIEFSGETINILSHFIDLVHHLLGGFEFQFVELSDGLVRLRGEASGDHRHKISIIQTYAQNLGDHSITFKGSQFIKYSSGGGMVHISSSQFEFESGRFKTISFIEELQGMIGAVVDDYLSWALGSSTSRLDSSITSSAISLFTTMESLEVGS